MLPDLTSGSPQFLTPHHAFYGLAHSHPVTSTQFVGADTQLQCIFKFWMTAVSKVSSPSNLPSPEFPTPAPNSGGMFLKMLSSPEILEYKGELD